MPEPRNPLEQKAIEIVSGEKIAWDTATSFITERVAFNMRNLIRQLRKNYWGVFDEPVDPVTNRKKIWIPLTETLVEATVKNIDLDTKDINFRAKKPSAVGFTSIIRAIVKNCLDNQYFGEQLDMFERQLAIDGIAVWKVIETVIDGKKTFKNIPVDTLNVYIDPTAESIQQAYRFTERSIMTQEEVESQKDWMNTRGIVPTPGLNPTDSMLNTANSGSVAGTSKYIDVWEMWGMIPKYLITGNMKDTDEVDGHIIISGLDTAGKERLHLLEENKSGKKPYEEAWLTKVPGRWYGKGVAEKVMMLQLWVNTIVNIRINRSYVSQLGIFKIKRGAGITPQMLTRLPANGAITVGSMDDVEQLVMQEASQASYQDEQGAVDWSQRVTSAFEVVTGEALPSSTPATNAAIQSRSAQSSFTLIKEGLGFFLQRWMKRQVLPIIMKSVKMDEIVRLTDDPDKIREWDERIVNEMVYQQIEDLTAQGVLLDPSQVEAERQSAIEKLSRMSPDRYTNLKNKIDPSEYDVQVYITNEEMDKGVLAQNLISMLQLAPEYRDQIVQSSFDLMGLDFKKPQANPMMQQGIPMGSMQGNPTIQSTMTEANTLNG